MARPARGGTRKKTERQGVGGRAVSCKKSSRLRGGQSSSTKSFHGAMSDEILQEVDFSSTLCVCAQHIIEKLQTVKMDDFHKLSPNIKKPIFIEVVDNYGYRRRIIIRKTSTGSSVISFDTLADRMRKIFDLKTEYSILLVYRREGGDLVGVGSDIELDAVCMDLLPGETLVVAPQACQNGTSFELGKLYRGTLPQIKSV